MQNSNNGKWVFIVNPVAGNGYAKQIVPILEQKLKEHNVLADIVFTDNKGHATDLAIQYCEKNYKYIIGVGGDGTINEIARAIIGKPNVITGIIPAGTGNDTIQICGFPNRFKDEHWNIFFESHIKPLDIGSCNGHIFLNGMGIGFDAQVAAENYTEDQKVKIGGAHKYIWHIVKILLFYKEKNMTMLYNGKRKVAPCFINTISIGRRFAAGFFLTPKAIANDELFDVCNVGKLGLFERINILLQVPKGKHIYNKKVNYFQTPELQIEFDSKMPFHADGELFFATKFDIQIRPAGLQIIYNYTGNHYFND